MMRKRFLERLALTLFFTILAGTAVVFAQSDYYKTFTFSFSYGVNGTTKFELENKSTSLIGRANTYEYAPDENGEYIIVPEKKKYKFTLYSTKFFGPRYETKWFVADNSESYDSFDTVEAGNYTVDVSGNEDLGVINRRIKGNGAVQQPQK